MENLIAQVLDLKYQLQEAEAENQRLKLRIHRANKLLDNCFGWISILANQDIGKHEPGWKSFIEKFNAYQAEIHQISDWWSWDKEGGEQ